MRPSQAFALTVAILVGASLALAQNTGRFAERTQRGIDFIDKGRFNEAINVLEEVWEQDQSDPAVAENLGVAYLYADHNVQKALEYMEASIAIGGRASFLMQHAHEKVAVLSSEMADYCTGRLSISPGRLAFTASIPAHSFSLTDFREIKTNRWFGKGEGTWHIRTTDKKIYNLRPRSWNEGETRLVLSLTDKYLKEK